MQIGSCLFALRRCFPALSSSPPVRPRAGARGLHGQSHGKYYCALILPGENMVLWRVPGHRSYAETTRAWGARVVGLVPSLTS